jgi:peroxiredoxin
LYHGPGKQRNCYKEIYKTIMMKIKYAVIIILFIIPFVSFQGRPGKAISGGIIVKDFELRNIDNSNVSLRDFKNAKGFIIVFTCNHCPFAKLYTGRLNGLNLKYKELGIPLIAINSMDNRVYAEESHDLMQQKASSEKYNFPYLQDSMQTAGKNFGATHTPHAFVIWKEMDSWVIKYSGAIDNNGEHPEMAHSYIDSALLELLNHKTVSKAATPSFGCRINYRK